MHRRFNKKTQDIGMHKDFFEMHCKTQETKAKIDKLG
jgi:hypothetical protein